jgi:hypothetical protein
MGRVELWKTCSFIMFPIWSSHQHPQVVTLPALTLCFGRAFCGVQVQSLQVTFVMLLFSGIRFLSGFPSFLSLCLFVLKKIFAPFFCPFSVQIQQTSRFCKSKHSKQWLED